MVLFLCTTGVSYAEPVDLIVPSKVKKNNSNFGQKLFDNDLKAEKDPKDKEISITTLKPIDPSSVGIYKEGGLGFSSNIWENSNREVIEALVSIIPNSYYSPSLRNLYKRIMLSEAKISDLSNDPIKLLELRIKKLASSGFVSLATELANLAPKNDSLGRFDNLFIEEKLLDGDNLSACDRVEEMFSKGKSSSFLLKHLSLCKIFIGDVDSSRLVIDLLHELDPGDNNFFSLASILIDGEQTDLSVFDVLSPLHLAMIKAAKIKIPDGIVTNVDPVVLKALAESPNTSLSTRIYAAEKAVSLGIIGAEKLSAIYSNIVFDKDRVNYIFEGEIFDQIDSKALLYQIAKTQVVPEAKAEVLHKSSLLAYKENLPITNYSVNIESYLEIYPNNSLAWFAGDAIAALLYLDKEFEAMKWFKLINSSGNLFDPNIQRANLNLWPIFFILDPSISSMNINNWVDEMIKINGGKSIQQIEITLGLLQNFNLEIPHKVWIKLLKNNDRANSYAAPSMYIVNFENAIDGDKVGESILYSLLMLGNSGKELNPSIGLSVVKGLSKLNLYDESKKIAIEILLSYYNPLLESDLDYQKRKSSIQSSPNSANDKSKTLKVESNLNE
ncbi:MAG: hypothetical protein CFH01_00911 [Alphaproteobacteria bacterium MarineAlpha2_Bin1]|nr:MAG: hypothetical protein CFH01_00911 [Alphaproteobacteria bacterium MarineAlpha2_Bin1]